MPTPRATYRVQLHAGFTFDDAAAIVPYLADLGISHLYCSPYLQAAPGSTHGYDVVDHHRLNQELGGQAAFDRLCAALREHGLSQVLDIVPNHMATAGRANAWWWDVLENGPASRYASYFDIDWDPPERKLIAQVLVPVLGDHYGRVLENGELALERDGGSFTIRYHEHELPVSPRSLDDLLARAAARIDDHPELASLATAFGRLPHALITEWDSVLERHRDKEVLRTRLAELCAADPAVALAVDEEVKAVNDDVDVLDRLLDRQNYRLAFWRTAGRELDYRRFFDITTLVALRAEDEHVFADTHELVLQLVADGAVEGLRVDHVDGLRDPKQYLERLRAAAGSDTYLVVEKILEGDERLRSSWPIDGTSGYDFLVQVNDLLHDPAGAGPMTAAYEAFTGSSDEVEELARAAKHEIMRTVLAADVERLTAQFAIVAEGHRRYRDHTRAELRDALREVIASFDVYRTYVVGDADPHGDAEDEEIVSRAVERAVKARPDLDPELFGLLGDLLVLRYDGPAEVELAERFQQVSSPVMAKAVEDTVFYRYLRMISLNEVGGEPGHFGSPVAAFHERRSGAAEARSLLATSTHDTKRAEDVRARLAALTSIPDAWAAACEGWAATLDDGSIDRPTVYLFLQTVVGAWPLSEERAVQYLEKATKEAKVHTSWIDPVAEYDAAVAAFAERALGDAAFVASVEDFLASTGLVAAGRHNALVQTTLKLTCPGVPDVYQGTELWDLSLVDPDNRRPVDYDARRRALRGEGADVEGAEKQRLIRSLLHLRRDRPELFAAEAGYTPLLADGPDAERIVAFERAGGALRVVASRFPLRGTIDPGTTFADVLAGRPVVVLVDGQELAF